MSTKRQRKPIQRKDFVETDSAVDEDDSTCSPSSSQQGTSGEDSSDPLAKRASKRSNSSPSCEAKKRAKKTGECFTQDESRATFDFVLDAIRSRTKGRIGRVAKRRVETCNNAFWERCRQEVGTHRDMLAYRNHYNFFSRKLHEVQCLSLDEKVDLYYAMDIKVDKSLRQKLVDEFAVEFNGQGIITGSPIMTYWDLVHPESDSEDVNFSINNRNWSRFTEYEDGLMWQFVLDDINAGRARSVYTKLVWEEFKEKHKDVLDNDRNAETYRGRFYKILIHNIHLMPFDIVTKAAIYQHLDTQVPEEYRKTIERDTGALCGSTGTIVEWPNKPATFKLQSQPYHDIVGITSATKISTLRRPGAYIDTVPYTPDEDRSIWEFILSKARGKDRTHRIKEKMSGWLFWEQFIKSVPTKRTWQSLSQHFVEDLMENIMETAYDLKTKMELYYTLYRPVEEEALAQFQAVSDVTLSRGGAIRYAIGRNFLIGRKEREGEFVSDVAKPANSKTARRTNKSCPVVFDDLDQTPSPQEEEQDDRPNSSKYPYLPKPARPRLTRKRAPEKREDKSKTFENEPSSTVTDATKDIKREPPMPFPVAVSSPVVPSALPVVTPGMKPAQLLAVQMKITIPNRNTPGRPSHLKNRPAPEASCPPFVQSEPKLENNMYSSEMGSQKTDCDHVGEKDIKEETNAVESSKMDKVAIYHNVGMKKCIGNPQKTLKSMEERNSESSNRGISEANDVKKEFPDETKPEELANLVSKTSLTMTMVSNMSVPKALHQKTLAPKAFASSAFAHSVTSATLGISAPVPTEKTKTPTPEENKPEPFPSSGGIKKKKEARSADKKDECDGNLVVGKAFEELEKSSRAFSSTLRECTHALTAVQRKVYTDRINIMSHFIKTAKSKGTIGDVESDSIEKKKSPKNGITEKNASGSSQPRTARSLKRKVARSVSEESSSSSGKEYDANKKVQNALTKFDNEIKIGDEYQAEIIDYADDMERRDAEIQIWKTPDGINEELLHTFVKSTAEQYIVPIDQVLYLLANNEYDTAVTIQRIMRQKEREIKDVWTQEEIAIFEQFYYTYGKDFSRIQAALPHRSIQSLVKHYYETKNRVPFKEFSKRCWENGIMLKEMKEDSNLFAAALANRCENCAELAENMRHNEAMNRYECAACFIYFQQKKAPRPTCMRRANIEELISDEKWKRMLHGHERLDSKSTGITFFNRGSEGQATYEPTKKIEFDTKNSDTPLKTVASISEKTVCMEEMEVIFDDCRKSKYSAGMALSNVKIREVSSLKNDMTSLRNRLKLLSKEPVIPVTKEWTVQEKKDVVRCFALYGPDFASISKVLGSKSAEQVHRYYLKKYREMDKAHTVYEQNMQQKLSDFGKSL